jgi:hypothetical protein
MSGLADLIQDMSALAAGMTGSTGTLSRTTPGDYNAATGASTGNTTTCPCLVVPDASSIATLGFRFGQDLVRVGDVSFDIPNKGLTFVPASGDQITTTLDGVSSTFTIASVQPDYFQGVATNYSCLSRK